MAEKASPNKVFAESTDDNIDCAVCLQPCVHPTVLPCRHVFCFLCVKGLGRTTRTCAMCRQQFPSEVLENPSLLRPVDMSLDSGFEDGQQWYYEGRSGWWQYDERTSKEIEVAFQEGSKSCEISISGRMYVIDFDKMEQRQKFSVSRSRRIKRDSISIPKKGVSGIRASPRTPNDDSIERRFSRLNLC